jgi:hypothetical protein
MRSIFYILAISFCVCLFTNCRVEKRLYRKGYHVVWNQRNSEKSKQKQDLIKQNPELVEAAVASSQKEIVPFKPSAHLLLKDTCGDKLLLQNADELLVKVMEISDESIKYKRCDNIDGPTYTIRKNKVALIIYANGVKEVIKPEPVVKSKEELNQEANRADIPRKVNPTGLASLLLYIGSAILSRGITVGAASISAGLATVLLIASLGSLILAFVALFQFKNEPNKYKGRWMPLTVVGINIGALLIVGLALLLNASLYGGGLGIIALICFLVAAVLIGILVSALSPKKTNSSGVRR